MILFYLNDSDCGKIEVFYDCISESQVVFTPVPNPSPETETRQDYIVSTIIDEVTSYPKIRGHLYRKDRRAEIVRRYLRGETFKASNCVFVLLHLHTVVDTFEEDQHAVVFGSKDSIEEVKARIQTWCHNNTLIGIRNREDIDLNAINCATQISQCTDLSLGEFLEAIEKYPFYPSI